MDSNNNVKSKKLEHRVLGQIGWSPATISVMEMAELIISCKKCMLLCYIFICEEQSQVREAIANGVQIADYNGFWGEP